MEFRFYRKGDEAGIVEAINASFGSFRNWGLTPEKWLGYGDDDYAFKKELALVAEDDGRIVGHLHLIARRLRFGDKYITIGGIANVTTIPEYRGRGIASKLVEKALEYCKSQGIGLSSLFTGYPGTPHRVYWRKGFADTEFEYGYTAEGIQLPTTSNVLEFEELGKDDVDIVSKIYEKYSPEGIAWRPKEYWLNKILGEKVYYQSFFYRKSEYFIRLKALYKGKVVGYLIAVKPWDEKREGIVLETVGEQRFLREIYCEVFKRLIKAGAKTVKVAAPRSHRKILRELLLVEGHGIYMATITHFKNLFENLSSVFEKRLEEKGIWGKNSIKIGSEYGSATLKIDGYEVTIGDEKAEAEVFLGKNEITRIIHGFTSFSQTLYSPHTSIKATNLRKIVEILDTIFPKVDPYIWPIDHW